MYAIKTAFIETVLSYPGSIKKKYLLYRRNMNEKNVKILIFIQIFVDEDPIQAPKKTFTLHLKKNIEYDEIPHICWHKGQSVHSNFKYLNTSDEQKNHVIYVILCSFI